MNELATHSPPEAWTEPVAATPRGPNPEPVALPGWLDREAYPFEPRRFDTRDGTMSYVDTGTGAPFLFVHGTPSWSFEWRHALGALSSRARCVAPDHLGFGLSDKPRDAPYRPQDHARRLTDLVRELDLREVSLVLHDFGGPIGLGLLEAEAWRIRRVVLVNTWAWPLGSEPSARWLSRLVRSWLGRYLYLRLNASPRWLLPASFADRSRLTRASHGQYLAPFGTPQARMAPWVLGCELTGSDPYYARLWEQRARLAAVPVSLVWGTADRAFTPAYLERWSAALPHANVVQLEGAGHFPQEEAPERFVAALSAES